MGTPAAMMDIYIEKAIRDHISYNKLGHISSSSAAYNNNSSPYQACFSFLKNPLHWTSSIDPSHVKLPLNLRR
jgi:hypothetical protein